MKELEICKSHQNIVVLQMQLWKTNQGGILQCHVDSLYDRLVIIKQMLQDFRTPESVENYLQDLDESDFDLSELNPESGKAWSEFNEIDRKSYDEFEIPHYDHYLDSNFLVLFAVDAGENLWIPSDNWILIDEQPETIDKFKDIFKELFNLFYNKYKHINDEFQENTMDRLGSAIDSWNEIYQKQQQAQELSGEIYDLIMDVSSTLNMPIDGQ